MWLSIKDIITSEILWTHNIIYYINIIFETGITYVNNTYFIDYRLHVVEITVI